MVFFTTDDGYLISNYHDAGVLSNTKPREIRHGVRLQFCRYGYARKRAGTSLQNRRLPPGRLPDSANSRRFHSTPLQSRQRTAPLARSFIALHSTLELSETGRMNRPCHASCESHEGRQLRPLKRNLFETNLCEARGFLFGVFDIARFLRGDAAEVSP